MNELAIRDVLRYIEPNKRFQLILSIPSLQPIHRHLPLNLDFFDLSTSEFTINSKKYELKLTEKSINRPGEPSDEYPAMEGPRESGTGWPKLKKSEIAEKIRRRRDGFFQNFRGSKRDLQFFTCQPHRDYEFERGRFRRDNENELGNCNLYFGFEAFRKEVFSENLEFPEEQTEIDRFPGAFRALKQTKKELIGIIGGIEPRLLRDWNRMREAEKFPRSWELKTMSHEMKELEYLKENLKILQVLISPPEIVVKNYKWKISDPSEDNIKILEPPLLSTDPIELFGSLIFRFLGNRDVPISIKSMKALGHTPIPEDVILKPLELECRCDVIEKWEFRKNLDLSGLERLSVFGIRDDFAEFCEYPVIKNLKFLKIQTECDEHDESVLNAIAKLPIKDVEINLYKNDFTNFCDMQLLLLWIGKLFENQNRNSERIGKKLKIVNFTDYEIYFDHITDQYNIVETTIDGKKYLNINLDQNLEIRIFVDEQYESYNPRWKEMVETNDVLLEVVPKI